MKRSPAAAIALAIMLFQLPTLLAQDGIKLFEGSWEKVLAEARQQNKPIYLDAYASWCGPCKILKRDIFPRADVGAYFNANYISVSIDMEKGEGIELAQRYDVGAYPTHLYFDPDGTIVHRAVGGGAGDAFAKQFVQWAQDARDPEKQLYTAVRRFEAGERDANLLRRLALGAAEAGMDLAQYYEIEYLRTQEREDITSPGNWEVVRTLATDFSRPTYGILARNREAFAKRYGAAAVESIFLRVAGSRLARIEGEKRYATSLMQRGDSIFNVTTGADDVKALGGSLLAYYESTKDWTKYAEVAARYIELGKVDAPEQLNEVAWAFYEHVDDKAMLARAEKWAAQALAAAQTYSVADTYAALLYKLGRKNDALKAAEHAIELGRTSGDDVAGTEELLVRIKAM